MRIKAARIRKQKYTADFGLLFKQIRKSSVLTQQKMAEKIGVSQSEISKIENGRLMPDLMTWFILRKEFKSFQKYLDELAQSIVEEM